MKKVILIAAGVLSGAALLHLFVRKSLEGLEDLDLGVIDFAGGSREQDGEPGDQYDEADCPCACPCCPEGPCSFKE